MTAFPRPAGPPGAEALLVGARVDRDLVDFPASEAPSSMGGAAAT